MRPFSNRRRHRSALLHAFRGETLYRVCSMDLLDAPGEPTIDQHVDFVSAISVIDAIRQISAARPKAVIWLLEPAKERIGIDLLITYPCRAARWILAYRQTRRIHLQAVEAVLLIQARQAVLREIEHGSAALEVAIPADATAAPAQPADEADDAILRGEAVILNDHGVNDAAPAGRHKTFPTVIEEVIRQYIHHMAAKLAAAGLDPHLSIFTTGHGFVHITFRAGCWKWKPEDPRIKESGSSLGEAVDAVLEAHRAHDPVKAKRDHAQRLLAEAAAMEKGVAL